MSGLDAYQRHKKLMSEYLAYYKDGKKDMLDTGATGVSELEVLKEHHKFLRDEPQVDGEDTWETRLARKYYDALFKEYCLANLSRYKTSQLALRWRTKKEVISGKGQFVCGNLDCQVTDELRSWEVNFGYVEDGVKKNALVKLRLCTKCSYKLNYRKIKEREAIRREERKRRREERTEEKKKRVKIESNDELTGGTSDTEVSERTKIKTENDHSHDALSDNEDLVGESTSDSHAREMVTELWNSLHTDVGDTGGGDDVDRFLSQLTPS
ncbi:folate-sensitive fragile site protein Fra10Ac1-domain-containing protein [Gaertneriomyces semiglobifer]|nr:folate-sensitive fragile site protein Fra10Ac1-domain-containing protein [Gaertneriomyces semiglobifer]